MIKAMLIRGGVTGSNSALSHPPDIGFFRISDHRAKAIEIFLEMGTSARNIRSPVSGYIQSVDGKAW